MEIPEPGEVFHGDDGTTSVVLAESHDPNYEPTPEELEEYAAYIGLDLAKEPQLKWIAMEGLRAPLPSEWRACKTGDGEIYYFNFANGESMWEHPLDEKFKQKVIAERGKLSSATSSSPTSARAKTTTTTTSTTTANTTAATRSETPKTSHTAESSARRTHTGTGATKAISDALLGFSSEETHKGIESSTNAGPPGLLLRPGLNNNSSNNGNNALTHLIPPRLETLPTASSLSGRPALPDVLTESGTHHGSPALDAVAHMTPVTNLSSGSSPAPFGALALGSPGLTPTSTTTPSSGAMMGSRDIEATIRKRVEDEYAPRRRAVRLQLDKELIAERAQLAQKLSALRDELQQARQRDKAQGTTTSSKEGSGDAAQEEEQVWARRLQAAQTQHDALQSKVKEREAAVQEVRGRSLLQLEKDLAARTSEELDARRRTLQDEIDAEVKAIDTEGAAKLQALQSELEKELNEVKAAEEAATRRADERNAQQSEMMLKMLREALRSQQEKLAEAKRRLQQQQQEKKEVVKDNAAFVSSEKDEAIVRQVEQACAEALASLEADYAQQEASLEAKIEEAKKALEANTKAKSEDTTKTSATTKATADVSVDYAAKLKAEEARLSAELQRARIAYEQETNALVAKASASTASSVAPVQSQQQQQQDKPSSAVQEAEKACTQSSQRHAIRTRHVAALKQLELSHEKTMRELRQSHTQRLAQLGKFDPRTTPEYNSGLTERKRAWLVAHPAPTFTSSPTTTKTSSADNKATVQVSSSSATAAAMKEEAMDEVTVDEAEVHKAVQERLVTLRKEMHEAQAKALDELAKRNAAELASFGERYRTEQLKKARSELEQEKQRMMDTAQEEDSDEKKEEDEEEESESDVTDEALAKLRESVATLKQRVAEADTTTQTTDSKTEAAQQQDVVKEDIVPLEQATQEQNALRTHWQAILQALHDAIAQEMERHAQLRRTLMTSSTTQTITETASMSAPLPLPASSIAHNNTTAQRGTTVSNNVNGDGQAVNLSVSHDKPPTAPAAWANNPRASTPPMSWTTTTAPNNTTVNSAAAAAQAMNTPIHASQRIPSHAVGEASLLASHGTQRPHTHPYSDREYDSNSGPFATLPHFTSATPNALPHGLVSSALRPAPHSPLASTSGFIVNSAAAGPRQYGASRSTQNEQTQTQSRNAEGEANNSKKDDNVREAVVGDVDTAMISGRRSPWYSSSVNSSVSGAAEGSASETSPVSLVSYGQRLAVLRDALHARRQALLACQRELQDVRAEWRRDMHACKVRHDRAQAQELRKTKEALEQYARALNEAVLRVKAASHEWRAQQARYRATLAALTAQQQQQQEKERDDGANEGGVVEGSGRQMQRPVTQRSGAESQAVSSGTNTTTAESGGSASFMAEQLQHLVRRAAELEKMLPSARQAA